MEVEKLLRYIKDNMEKNNLTYLTAVMDIKTKRCSVIYDGATRDLLAGMMCVALHDKRFCDLIEVLAKAIKGYKEEKGITDTEDEQMVN